MFSVEDDSSFWPFVLLGNEMDGVINGNISFVVFYLGSGSVKIYNLFESHHF